MEPSTPDLNADKNSLQLEHWFVLRAYKRETKAEELLLQENVRHYLPKQYAVRVYHGVKSKRLVPAIPSLVFVHASRQRILELKKDYNFLQFITKKNPNGSVGYLTVPDRQMDDFIRVASENQETNLYFTPDEIDLQKGTRVRILGGDLDGVEGIFMQVKGKRNRRIVVQLDGLLSIAAEIHPDLVKKI